MLKLKCPTNLVGTLLFRAPLVLVMLLLLLLLYFDSVSSMRVNPERIAARLRIEEEIEMDKLLSRNRRQLGVTPKEISISVTAPLFSSRLFSYGPEANDQELPQSLDVGKKFSLTYPLNFYGQEQYTVYILSNGGIGFDATSRSYKSNILPNNVPMIAPFWNRNDLRNGGHVYYREEKSSRVLERGQSEIRYQYELAVKVKSCLLVTWEKMQPHGAAALPDENTNTFQAALFITSNGTYANFIYKNIGWTQGAEAGFNKGDSNHYYALPTSGTGNVMYLEEYGNTGIPGEWMFVMNEERVERCRSGVKGDTCDEECAVGEWGPDCVKCCHCASGSCNTITGECPKGQCAECWTGGPTCQTSKNLTNIRCPHNAVTFVDYDRCGEPVARCQCLAGYTGVGNQECIDINECAEPHTCHPNALCTNTPGGYFCQCNEGYSGDGITKCVSSFFYPYNGHQTLPKSKGAKLLWQMKVPIIVFGELRDHFTVSTNGVIAIESDINLNAPLETSGIHGIAPFFAPIDTTERGEIFIDESTDSDVLTRATRIVRENYRDESFVATNTLTVTYINVTDGHSSKENSFQVLLISGTNQKEANLTFAQLLYKKLSWSFNAEAGIMSYDDENSILLPGSGTEGIEQLSQLSNIKVPGQWLYRIDTPVIPPCASINLQPPYCLHLPPQKTPIVSIDSHDIEDIPPDAFDITLPAVVTTISTVVTSKSLLKNSELLNGVENKEVIVYLLLFIYCLFVIFTKH
uniref:EGF-like domain-containing protein n=1 Tax=Syphacia muris TaxID=451379 RepID=A0A0N5AG61_9BILA